MKKDLQKLYGLLVDFITLLQNPVLYLHGDPSTYKTFLIKTIFDKLVGLHSVEVVSRQNGRFNLAKLRKDDNQPYIIVIDDYRWETLGMHVPDFINLLDAIFVHTERKYKQAHIFFPDN